MFTLSEYIAKHGLRANPLNPAHSKILNEHLARLGYVRVRRNGRWGYVKQGEIVTPSDLTKALEKLALES